jgi:hypothetical protein
VNTEEIVVVCPPPLVAAIVAAGPGVFVRPKLAGVGTPLAVAVTAYPPAAVFAVALVVARPLLSVVTVVGRNVASAPLDGPAKVTLTPGTGLPEESLTSATSDEANAVVTAAD